MTRETYVEKELARVALAKLLMIQYTVDVSNAPEADLLMFGPVTCQAVLAREVAGEIAFDPVDAVGDYIVFMVKDDERTFRAVGYLSTDEGQDRACWLVGRLSLEETNPVGELIRSVSSQSQHH